MVPSGKCLPKTVERSTILSLGKSTISIYFNGPWLPYINDLVGGLEHGFDFPKSWNDAN
jgi:hypothetical protein